MHGGDRIAEVLEAHGVPFLFTLCGGHISPILSACKRRAIRVVDVRHEATAVFAADAVARLTGTPGVAAVTAGPGLTNTITAVKNASMAQSPVVLLGGATATALKGRGALQDIDQMALLRPHVKSAATVKRVRDLVPAVERAFAISRSGTPGPAFVECPVDLLYEESAVRDLYGSNVSGGAGAGRLVRWYLRRHVDRLFAGAADPIVVRPSSIEPPLPRDVDVRRAAARLRAAGRPLLLVGSQALLEPRKAETLARDVERLGIPVYLTGMARGLLGAGHRLQCRHRRREALREADVVVLAGVPCDFRLGYGRQIRRSTVLVSANRSRTEMKRNRRPDVEVPGDPGRFLRELAERLGVDTLRWEPWREALRARDAEREEQIAKQAAREVDGINPLRLCREIEDVLPPQSVLVADGGDFVGTASYILRPRGPLSWLDPGAFGTLGVGAGFALGAALCRPEAEVWILYGDGSAGYSLAEFDTFVRHGVPIIAVVGNDACWMQIAREQLEILGDDVGCVLRRTDYDAVAQGFGAVGIRLGSSRDIAEALGRAKAAAARGKPVLVNALLGKTDFRKGSISL